jgi:hypothetical protein
MTTSIDSVKPKLFRVFRVFCIFLGCLGTFQALMFLLLKFAFSIVNKEIFNIQGYAFLVYLEMIPSLILLIAGIWLFKLKNFGRLLILVCVTWDLLTSIYTYVQFFSETPFLSYVNLSIVSFVILDVLILLYFLRRDVKEYIITHG